MRMISILGCGWLGFPLAKKLITNGFSVKGSTTSIEKMKELEHEKILPFLIHLNEEKVNGNVAAFLSNSDILLITIPPKLRVEQKENFVQKVQNFISFIEDSTIKKVLFVSSTSVYGKNNGIVTEETFPNPTTESGKQLLEVESILQANTNFRTTILRFGGLIGNDRQPVKYLAGKENLENPDAPINLIHQEDCINIIETICERNCFGKTYNAVAPFHPTRKEYYTQKAIELNLTLPKFKDNGDSGKIIDSSKLVTDLKYSYLFETF